MRPAAHNSGSRTSSMHGPVRRRRFWQLPQGCCLSLQSYVTSSLLASPPRRWLAGILRLWLDEEWGPQPPHKMVGEVAADHYKCAPSPPPLSAVAPPP